MENKDLLEDKKIPLGTMLKRIVPYIKKEAKSIILSLILIVFSVLVSVIVPRISGYYVDYIDSENPVLKVIIIVAIGMLVLSILSEAINFVETMVLTKAGQRIVYRLRMEVFSHIESMSQNQFNDMAVGSLVTRVCNYTAQLSNFFTNILVRLIKNVLTVLIVYIFMMTLSWQLGLLLLGVVLLVFVISYFFSKNVHKLFRKERGQTSDLNTYLNESLSGMKIIQMFNQEKRFADTFKKKNDDFFKTRFYITLAFSMYRPLISLIYILSIALIIFMGVKLNLTAGSIVAFYLYLGYFFDPIQQLADELNNITRSTTAMERLLNLLDIEPEVIDVPDAVELEHFDGKIEFKNR